LKIVVLFIGFIPIIKKNGLTSINIPITIPIKKSTLRIISRVAILLVVMGFFMPMGCDQTGFELAERLGKATNDTSFGMALYGLFISALIGGGLLIPLAMKKKVHIGFDWISLVVSFVFAIFAYSKIKDYFQAYGEMGGQTLQIGSWFVIIGLIGSLLSLLLTIKKTENESG
jgi:hypothetical protein